MTSYDIAPAPTDRSGADCHRQVWFIAMADRGVNREVVTAALARGDTVIAAVADIATLDRVQRTDGDGLTPMVVDFADRRAVVDAVARCFRRFGRLDVIVNVPTCTQFGFVEELTERHVRHHMELNFFAALWVIQAALPYLRAQRYGHIIQHCLKDGVGALPDRGIYTASSRALAAISEALAHEVAPFGIRVSVLAAADSSMSMSMTTTTTNATMLPAYARGHLAANQLAAPSAINTENPLPGEGVRALLDLIDDHASPPPRMPARTAEALASVDHG